MSATPTDPPQDQPPDRTPGRLITVRLPLPWDEFDLTNPLATRWTVLATGDPAWAWTGTAPDLGIPLVDPVTGNETPGWDLDHIVLLVPDLDAAADELTNAGLTPRLRIDVRGRPTAFYRVGPILEVIQSPVRSPSLFGAALVTDEPLEVVALRWRALGRDVSDPRPAMQPGRRIITVRATEAGFAVMSGDRARP